MSAIRDSISYHEEITQCLTQCYGAQLLSGYCEMMCLIKPHELVSDLDAISGAPFWSFGENDRFIAEIAHTEECLGKCITRFWYTSYCNYVCYNQIMFATTTTAAPTSTTTTATTTTTTGRFNVKFCKK